jgi:hypothetical protein
MSLALLQKELDNVDVQLRRLGQAHTIGRRSTLRWLSDAQSRSFANWHNLRDGRLSIEDRDRLAAADGPKILAQPGLQLGDSHLSHDYIMTINGHERTPGAVGSRKPVRRVESCVVCFSGLFDLCR